MRLLDDLYYKPLTAKKIIKQKYINALFGEIETIINLNDNLLTTLRENKKDDKIGQAMLQFIPFLKMYQNYINNHENSTKILSDLKDKNNSFSSFLSEQRRNEKTGGLGLGSFLILPIQRVPRYELCLREIIKLTDPDNSDLPNLKDCYERVCAVNKSINTDINDFHDREKVKEVEERFGMGHDVSLVSPARRYVREGYLKKVSRKKDIRYLFILFSDILIYCSGERNKLKLHQRLHFDLYFKIKRVDNNRKYGNKCFELNSTEKSFLVICEDHAVREDWVKSITQCLDKMRANRKLADSKAADGRVLDVAPVWIPDDFSERCMVPQCMKKFNMMRRRHHCRYCGRLICGDCSKNKLPHFHKDKKEVVRVGNLCYDKYKASFPEFDLKFNRKSKASFNSVSATPKGAEYELNWDDSEESEDSEEDEDTRSVHSHRVLSPSTSQQRAPTVNAPPSPRRVTPYKQPQLRPASSANVSTESVPSFPADAQPQGRSSSIGGANRMQAMIGTMQTKLNKERKTNKELQGQIEDLRAENQRLRKSKVDLTAYWSSEVERYKAEIRRLRDQLKGATPGKEGQ